MNIIILSYYFHNPTLQSCLSNNCYNSLFIMYPDSHTPALIMYRLAMLLLLFVWPLTLHCKV